MIVEKVVENDEKYGSFTHAMIYNKIKCNSNILKLQVSMFLLFIKTELKKSCGDLNDTDTVEAINFDFCVSCNVE